MSPPSCIVLFRTKSEVTPPDSEATITFSHTPYKDLYIKFLERKRKNRLSHRSSKQGSFGASKLDVVCRAKLVELTINKKQVDEDWRELVPFCGDSRALWELGVIDPTEIRPERFKTLMKVTEEEWTIAWKSAITMREPRVSAKRKGRDEIHKVARRHVKEDEKIPKTGNKKDGKGRERRKRKVRNETSKRRRDKARKRKQKEDEDEERKRRRRKRRQQRKKHEEEKRRREWERERERRKRDRERRRRSKEPKVRRRRLLVP